MEPSTYLGALTGNSNELSHMGQGHSGLFRRVALGAADLTLGPQDTPRQRGEGLAESDKGTKGLSRVPPGAASEDLEKDLEANNLF